YDQATGRLETANLDASFKRKLIRLADSGVSGTFGPGDFGYVIPEPGTVPNDGCFNQDTGTAMAMSRPLVCAKQNGIDLRTGNATEFLRGLNTRFGQYGNLSSTCRASYPPDVNVKTGYKPKG